MVIGGGGPKFTPLLAACGRNTVGYLRHRLAVIPQPGLNFFPHQPLRASIWDITATWWRKSPNREGPSGLQLLRPRENGSIDGGERISVPSRALP